MDQTQIEIEEKQQAIFRSRARQWELACRAIRSKIITPEQVPIQWEWVETFHAASPNVPIEQIVVLIRQSLATAMTPHTEISEASAAAINAANKRADGDSDQAEFWRGLHMRLAESEREYP